MYTIDGYPVAQIRLPAATDDDPHPYLQLQSQEIHAGTGLTVWLPDGWHDVRLEMRWEITGPGCWYIAAPALTDVCPVGLWCRI